MRRWSGLLALVGALLAPPAFGASDILCTGPITAAANGNYPSAAPWILNSYGSNVSTWLNLTTPGSGTVVATINIYGPPVSGGAADQGRTGRATAIMCTMDATWSHCELPGHVYALDFTLAGCTACSVQLSACGMSAGTGQ